MATKPSDRFMSMLGKQPTGNAGTATPSDKEPIAAVDYAENKEQLVKMGIEALAEMVIDISGQYLKPAEFESMVEKYTPEEAAAEEVETETEAEAETEEQVTEAEAAESIKAAMAAAGEVV